MAFLLYCNVCFLVCVSHSKESEGRDLKSFVSVALLFPEASPDISTGFVQCVHQRVGVRKLPVQFRGCVRRAGG